MVEGLELDTEFKVNPLYALMPVVPIAILILGATKMVPMFKMGVAQAMVIGAILTCIVTRTNPAALTKSFFDGMGKRVRSRYECHGSGQGVYRRHDQQPVHR